MKFKVGDKVVVTGNVEPLFPIGTVGTVIEVDEEDDLYPYLIEDDSGQRYWYNESNLNHFSKVPEGVVSTRFKIGERVTYVRMPENICKVVDIDFNDLNGCPYKLERKDGSRFWTCDSMLEPYLEKGEETEMPKQKDLYDFDNMTDDDLEMLINKANEALINKNKNRLMTYLDDALNALREFQVLDHNTAMTSSGNTVEDIIYDLEDLENYYN